MRALHSKALKSGDGDHRGCWFEHAPCRQESKSVKPCRAKVVVCEFGAG